MLHRAIILLVPALLAIAPISVSAQSVTGTFVGFRDAGLRSGPLNAYLGYSVGIGPIRHSLSSGTPLQGYQEFTYKTQFSGPYISISYPFALQNIGQLVVSGSMAITSTGDANARWIGSSGTTILPKDWQTDSSWGNLESMLAISIHKGVSGLLGFRWISWQTSYSSPQFNPGIANFSNTDDADFKLNLYQPLIGLSAKYDTLIIQAIVFPLVIGNMEHRESFNNGGSFLRTQSDFNEGVFGELSLEYGIPVGATSKGSNFFVFAKAQMLHANSFPMVEIRSAAQQPSIGSFDFSFEQKLLAVGAKAVLPFNLFKILGL